jgi:hypothetical protein
MRRALQRRLDGPTTVPADVVSRMGGRAVDRCVDFPEGMVRDIRNSWVLMACRSISDLSRGPNSPCQWLAECEVDGPRCMARSRHGAVHELGRALVAAGIEDRPVADNHPCLADPLAARVASNDG